MSRILNLVLAMALGAPLAARAAPAPAAPPQPAGAAPTLAEASAQAWQRLPFAQSLTGLEGEARADGRVAASWTPAPPAISLGSLNDRLNARSGKQEWEAELAVPLWQPGQREARQGLARARQTELAAQVATQRLEVAGRVREAWWELAAARQTGALALRRLQSARALHTDVARRWRAGDLPRTDANAAQAEVQLAEAGQIDALRAEQLAQDRLQALTGAAAPATLPAESAPPTLPAESAPTQGAEAAAAAHPALATAAAAAHTAQQKLRLTDRSLRAAPELSLRLVRERGNAGEPYANAVGIKFSLPLSSAASVSRESYAARAELAAAESRLPLLARQLQLDQDAARRDIDAAARRAVLAGSRAALAADTLQLMQKSFALGESDLQTLLRARAAAFNADADVERESIARAAAASRLLQSLGVMP